MRIYQLFRITKMPSGTFLYKLDMFNFEERDISPFALSSSLETFGITLASLPTIFRGFFYCQRTPWKILNLDRLTCQKDFSLILLLEIFLFSTKPIFYVIIHYKQSLTRFCPYYKKNYAILYLYSELEMR